MVLLTVTVAAILTVIAGMIVLIWPKSLNIAVGLWLIITGFLRLIEAVA
jgi:hypothetical protein